MNELVITEKNNLIDVADAIRNKTGLTNEMNFPEDFLQAINGIERSSLIVGNFTPTANATSVTIQLDKTHAVKDFNVLFVFCGSTISASQTSFNFYSAYAISGTQSYVTLAYTKSSTNYLSRSTLNSGKFGNICTLNNDIFGNFDTITLTFSETQISNGCVFTSTCAPYIYILAKI